jgi:hypothetical protein
MTPVLPHAYMTDAGIDERRLRSDPIARLAHQHLLKPDSRVVIVTGPSDVCGCTS